MTKIYMHQAEDMFEEFLDSVYETVSICGHTWDAGRALRKLDPIAFREEFLNWLADRDDDDITIIDA